MANRNFVAQIVDERGRGKECRTYHFLPSIHRLCVLQDSACSSLRHRTMFDLPDTYGYVHSSWCKSQRPIKRWILVGFWVTRVRYNETDP